MHKIVDFPPICFQLKYLQGSKPPGENIGICLSTCNCLMALGDLRESHSGVQKLLEQIFLMITHKKLILQGKQNKISKMHKTENLFQSSFLVFKQGLEVSFLNLKVKQGGQTYFYQKIQVSKFRCFMIMWLIGFFPRSRSKQINGTRIMLEIQKSCKNTYISN